MTNFARMAVAALAAGCLEAGTVIHYTFDSGNVGDVITNGSTIVNAANPGVHDATVYGISGASINSASPNMPVVTNGIPKAWRIYDPVSGCASAQVDRALRFPVKNSANGAILEVANAAALRPESFTVEIMVRMPKGEVDTSHWNVLAVQPAIMSCANADAWGLRLIGGTPVARFTPPQTFVLKANSDSVYENATGNIEISSGQNISNGRWHHVAFTCEPNASDSSKTDVSVYVDYKKLASKTLSFRPQFSDAENCPMWIGANRQTSGLHTGEIGEFRFSNVALAKEQFLRSRSAEYDPDVVIYYNFEDEVWFGNYDVQNVVDPLAMNGVFATNAFEGVGTFPCITNDSPYAKMRPSRGAISKFTSERCLENGYTNDVRAVNCYLHTPLQDDWFSKTNFTIECFYKSKGTIEQYTPFVFRFGGVNVQFNLGVGPSAGRLYGVVCPAGATAVAHQKTFAEATRSDDEQWHHAAMVVRQGESVKLYRDWSPQPVAQTTLTTNLYPRAVTGGTPDLYIAGGSGRNAFNGRLDEVRITLRALEPNEFICPFKSLGTQIRFK